MAKAAKIDRRERQKAETRAELLAAAHALVREDGYEGLTIRRLAERVGYATMSVYSYFPDKQAILLAIAQDAFAVLAQRMEANRPAEPLAALKALMWAYSETALENPNEYRTVFMGVEPPHDPDKSPLEMAQQNPALQLLMERVRDCIAAGHFSGDPHAIATMLWTIGHGTVSLIISFPQYPFGDRQAYIGRMIDAALAGLVGRTVAPLQGAESGC